MTHHVLHIYSGEDLIDVPDTVGGMHSTIDAFGHCDSNDCRKPSAAAAAVVRAEMLSLGKDE